jgi:hypothetical protein
MSATLSFPRRRLVALVVAVALGLGGCGPYSFSGATLPEGIDTLALPLAENNTVSPVATLDEDLTQLLTARFINQTRLRLETNQGAADARLVARIQRYQSEPTAVSGDERATLNRLTIRVDVTYVDQTAAQDSTLLDQSFSSFEDFDPAQGLSAERATARLVLENIANDIFSAATSNW